MALFEKTRIAIEKVKDGEWVPLLIENGTVEEELKGAETEINRLRVELKKYKSKEADYNDLLKSEGDVIIFKMSANVDEIANMVSIEGGGEYTIFVSDAFKTSEEAESELSNLAQDILKVLMKSVMEQVGNMQQRGGK